VRRTYGADAALSKGTVRRAGRMGQDRRSRRAYLRSDRRGEHPADNIIIAPLAEKEMNQHIDPVCGMTVEPAKAAGNTEYQGQTYYFCATGCQKKFETDPRGYLDRPQPALVSISMMGKPVNIAPHPVPQEAGSHSSTQTSSHSSEDHRPGAEEI